MQVGSTFRKAGFFWKLAFLVFLSADVHAGLFTDDEAQKKIAAQAIEIQDLKNQLADLQARVSRLEASTATMDLATQIQSIGADMGKLRGQIEELGYASQQMDKRQKDFYVDLDSRLKRLEPQQGASAPAAVATPSQSGDDAYKAAYGLIKNGDYAGAIQGFKDFLAAHPDSELAPAAQYWIGNAHFALRDFKGAIASQKILLAKYPDSPKVADALLNIASSQFELGMKVAAKKTMKQIVEKYPQSEAAQKAKRRLQSGR